MPYVDGFVVPVPKQKLDASLSMSRHCAAIWRELGALEFRACVARTIAELHCRQLDCGVSNGGHNRSGKVKHVLIPVT